MKDINMLLSIRKYYFYTNPLAHQGTHFRAQVKEEIDKLPISKMITQAYVFKKTKKFLTTFSSYDETDEVFSDTNIFPMGCIISMEKILD